MNNALDLDMRRAVEDAVGRAVREAVEGSGLTAIRLDLGLLNVLAVEVIVDTAVERIVDDDLDTEESQP